MIMIIMSISDNDDEDDDDEELCQIPLKGDHLPPRGKARGRFAPGLTARQPHPSKDFFQDFFHISVIFLVFFLQISY